MRQNRNILGGVMDWDAAYSNVDHVPDSGDYPPRWSAESAAFRAETGERAELDIDFGPGARENFDLFNPTGTAKGLAVFVHGGYWRRLDKNVFSRMAGGPLAHGWAVAVMGYALCPEVRIRDITRQIRAGVIEAAGRVDGPVMLAGHSAGGHLVTRMLCADVDLPGAVPGRIGHVLSISGVHDLRPILKTQMNEVLHLDTGEARTESPALGTPLTGIPVTCVAGAAELPEFRRQNALLANIWTGLGLEITARESEGKNHFNVIEELSDPGSPLVRTWLGQDMAGED